MTKQSSKSKSISKAKATKPKAVKKSTSNEKEPKTTNLELKLSVAFAGIAMLANILIYFFAILPTYNVIDGDTVSDLSDTLDSSERVTEIFTPIVFASLAFAVGLLTIGIYKYVRAKPQANSRTNSRKNP